MYLVDNGMLLRDLGLVNRLHMTLRFVNDGLNVMLLVDNLGMLVDDLLLHNGLVYHYVGSSAGAVEVSIGGGHSSLSWTSVCWYWC